MCSKSLLCAQLVVLGNPVPAGNVFWLCVVFKYTLVRVEHLERKEGKKWSRVRIWFNDNRERT